MAAEVARTRKQEKEPAGREVVEVGPGVLRLQLPISMPGLGHVNTYVLEDARGLAVVDPGLPGPATWRALTARLADAALPLRRVHTVLVTHSHPDHYGSAARLAREAGAELVTHEDFRTWASRPHRCTDPTHDHDEAGCDEAEDASAGLPPWARPTPWGGTPPRPPLKRRVVARLLGSGLSRRFAPPEPTRGLADGDVISLAGREWVARHTPGHTPDHLCLHDPTEGLLLSGDHVLPTITPHISGLGPEPDPLAAFLGSLDAVGALPDVRLVLPAHGLPFDDLPGRTAAIRAHHEERLDKLRALSEELGWATVAELSQRLFRRRSWGGMAESETYAHLEHLRLAGRAERRKERGRLQYLVG